MTVIACDGVSMAGDGRSIDNTGSICSERVVKVRKLSDGSIIGLAGTPYHIEPLVEWFEAGAERAKFPSLTDEWDCMRLMPDGRCLSYGVGGFDTEDEVPASIGSGGDIAMGAMLAGLSAKEAVKLACMRHNECGGVIIEHRLDR